MTWLGNLQVNEAAGWLVAAALVIALVVLIVGADSTPPKFPR